MRKSPRLIFSMLQEKTGHLLISRLVLTKARQHSLDIMFEASCQRASRACGDGTAATKGVLASSMMVEASTTATQLNHGNR